MIEPRFIEHDEFDDRLRAALQHAPDHAVGPPPAIAAAIRNAAHARRPPAPTPSLVLKTARRLWGAAKATWQELGAPRPVWAGGAAAVMVSVVTINMWIDEPVPAAVVTSIESPRRPLPVGTTSNDATASSASTAAATVPESTNEKRSPIASPAATPNSTASPQDVLAPKAAATARQGSSEAPTSATVAIGKPGVDSRPAVTLPVLPSAPVSEPVTASSTATPTPLTRESPMPATSPPQAPPPAPAAAAPANPGTPPTPAPRADTEPSKPQAAPPETPRTRDEAPIRLRSITRPGETIGSLSSGMQAGEANVVATPSLLGMWLRAATRDGDDPRWPLAAYQRRALLTLQAAPGLRWHAQPRPAPAPIAGSRDLNFAGENGVAAVLRIEPSGVRWIEHDGRHWFASLDSATAQSLLAAR